MSWRFLLGLLLLSGSSLLATAQVPVTVQWQKLLGDRTGVRDELALTQLLLTHHNRLVIAGTTEMGPWTGPSREVCTLWMTSAQGDSLRTVQYPQLPNQELYPQGIAEAPNGGFFITGTHFTATAREMFLLHTDSLGTFKWLQTFGDAGGWGYACQALPDGGALLVSTVQYPGYPITQPVSWPTVTRVDSLGRVRWKQHYGLGYDKLFSIAPLPDGSYVLAGHQGRLPQGQTQLDFNGWWLRLDARDGSIIRSTTFGTGPNNESFRDVAPTPDGGLLLVGSQVPPPPANEQGLIVKVNPVDQEEWRQAVNAPAPSGQHACAFARVLPLPQTGEFVLVGERWVPYVTLPNGTIEYRPFYVARYQTVGQGASPVWEYQGTSLSFLNPGITLGTNGTATVVTSFENRSTPTRQQDLRYTRLGGLPPVWQPTYCQQAPTALLAFTQPQPDSLVLFEASLPGGPYAGIVRWQWQIGQPGQPGYQVLTRDSAGWRPLRFLFTPLPPPGTAVQLTVTNNLGCTSSALVYPWGAPSATQLSRQLSRQLQLFPNPASATTTLSLDGLGPEPVTVELRNSLGQLLRPTQQLRPRAGQLRAELDVRELPPGVYLLHVRTGQGMASRRLIKQ